MTPSSILPTHSLNYYLALVRMLKNYTMSYDVSVSRKVIEIFYQLCSSNIT